LEHPIGNFENATIDQRVNVFQKQQERFNFESSGIECSVGNCHAKTIEGKQATHMQNAMIGCEYLKFSAQLKLPRNNSNSAINPMA
jgi:hypothetical protein